jgi:hypothetical protein
VIEHEKSREVFIRAERAVRNSVCVISLTTESRRLEMTASSIESISVPTPRGVIAIVKLRT